LTGFEPLSGCETHEAKVVVGAVPASVALDPMGDPEQRAAPKSGLDPERNGAFWERSAFMGRLSSILPKES